MSAHLPEDVPERDVDSADGVGNGATASLPEGHLKQLLRYPFWFDRRLPDQVRLEEFDRAVNESATRETAPNTGDPLVGLDKDECMQVFCRARLPRPPCLGCFTEQRYGSDIRDLHSILLYRSPDLLQILEHETGFPVEVAESLPIVLNGYPTLIAPVLKCA